MIDFYPQIKMIHIAAVVASGVLFVLRGLLVQTGRTWGMASPVRLLSYGIDTTLLIAAILLVAILPAAVYANGWLATKLALLAAYIGLGTFALKRGRTDRIRLACLVAAVVTYACMLLVARAHHPLGPLPMLLPE